MTDYETPNEYTKIRVIDFETTGFPPKAGIVEVGYVDVIYRRSDKKCSIQPIFQSLTNPNMPIEIGAMAVHHIMDEDLVDAPNPKDILLPEHPSIDYYCAHNSKFEKQFFLGTKPWICTLKAAYRLCPTAPNHQNQTIRYFLKTAVDRKLAAESHRAGPDAYVTAFTLAKFLTAATPEQLAEWETLPTAFPVCPMGKHKGEAWSEVPQSYLAWMCRTPDMEEDLKYCARRELDRRDGKL